MTLDHETLGIVCRNPTLAARICHLTRQLHWRPACYPNWQELIDLHPDTSAAVVEFHDSGQTAMELFEMLAARNIGIPLMVVVSRELNPNDVITGFRNGCFQFISESIDDLTLLADLRGLQDAARVYRACEWERRRFLAAFHSLSPQEQLVAKLMVAGKPNKWIAKHCDCSLRTIEGCRARILAKMGFKTKMELAQCLSILEGKVIRLVPTVETPTWNVKSTVLQMLANRNGVKPPLPAPTC